MLKAEKVEFVKRMHDNLKNYKVVGIMPLDAVPDRLVQKVKNEIKSDTQIVVTRKNLLLRVLGDGAMERLKPHVTGTMALILSNKDPFELYKAISSNSIKLTAKPSQVSPEDIMIEAGETAIAPGQAVTDLKTAGVDVQIQKGKVVITKSKVLVVKGSKISTAVSKALKMLDVYPFEARTSVNALIFDGLLFAEDVLKVNEAYVSQEVAQCFNYANLLSSVAGIVTEHNVGEFIRKAFISALNLGVEAKVPEGEVTARLLELASFHSDSLSKLVKAE